MARKRKWKRGVTIKHLGELMAAANDGPRLLWFKTKALPASFVLSMQHNYLINAIDSRFIATVAPND